MFYKYNEESKEWITGYVFHFPDGIIINADNKLSHDGFVWHDVAPDGFEEIIYEL